MGNLNLRNHEITEKDLGLTIKIISPNININRYFQNENTGEFISELINISEPNPLNENIYFTRRYSVEYLL